jgi:class 3 adenylate cyclase
MKFWSASASTSQCYARTSRYPEQALKVIEPILKLIRQAVLRYEGTVNLETRYGVIALFGVPLTHEDHALRACFAALQMRQTLKRHAQALQPAPGVPSWCALG